MKKGLFLIWESDDWREWTLSKHETLPGWLLDPDVLGELVNGMMCRRNFGLKWYRADVKLGAQAQARLTEALKTRDARAARRLLELPEDVPLHPGEVVDEPIRTIN